MKLQTILVATDLSETSLRAARFASGHFAPESDVVLLHVIDPPRRPRFAEDRLPRADVLEGVAREYATTRLQDFARQLAPRRARIEIRVGRPHEQVVAMAAEVGADLIVIGPHDDRPRPHKFLGTTADRIVRASPVPILVATNPPERAPARMLVAVDDDALVEDVMTWTRDLAERFGADVSLLHVWSNAVYSHVASMSYATTRTETAAREDIQKELSDAAARWLATLARTGLAADRVHATVAYGDAGEVTISTAEAEHADLIVLGRHGERAVTAAILGSTISTILHGARCPLLVVTRAPGDAR
jgi:nucleotide-binding universal stress UspA family protein